MKNEILNLLKREGMISDEIDDANINDFADLIEGIGRTEKEYIKSSEISKGLKTRYVGKNLYVFSEVGSTNTIAKFLSKNGIENGSVVIAEKQTAGRGRSGKSWESPLGGIWLSIILTPDVDYSKIPLITLATGVAVAKTLEEIGIENPEIKWPNDIMINGKKVCGILTEAITNFNTIDHVIIGVGIDANLSIEDFPKELQNTTTTLEREIGRVNENLLIKLFLEELEKIIELDWGDETNMRALILHEIGHLWHKLNGNLHIPEYTKRRKGIAQLYCEGVAMVCEHILCGDNDFYHQDKDGWLSWCYKNENQIKREYLRRLDKKESVQDFFGDWCSYNGYSDVGYFLGCRFVRYIMKSYSLKEIANMRYGRLNKEYKKFAEKDEIIMFEKGEYICSFDELLKLAENMCYYNAKKAKEVCG